MKNQPSQNKWNYFIYFSFVTLLIFSSILGPGCNGFGDSDIGDDIVVDTILCGNDGSVLQLNCPAVPNTTAFSNIESGFDKFAWNTFAALNWPALINVDTLQRGIPDLSRSFLSAEHNDVLVWETFKEKREVFNVNQADKALPSWNNVPAYGPLRRGSEADTSVVLGMLPGSVTNSGIIFNTLDETIQVKSEGLEDSVTNPKYKTNPYYGKVVSPRVWRGPPSKGNPVLYEVKVNYDFYRYVSENRFFNDDYTRSVARDSLGPIRLPYRTSAMAKPSYPPNSVKFKPTAASMVRKSNRLDSDVTEVGGTLVENPNRKPVSPTKVLNYLSTDALNKYKEYNTSPNRELFPPLIGAVHIKAAWIQLTDEDIDSLYHTTTAEYYVSEGKKRKRMYAKFGLVGLHIIQRIHAGLPGDSTAQQLGGTFIFATWEHKGNETGFTYSNYLSAAAQPTQVDTIQGWYPREPSPVLPAPPVIGHGAKTYLAPKTYDVKRKFKILPKTQEVNKKVWSMLPKNSVWQNYQLIGVQFKAIDINSIDFAKVKNINDPTNIGQPLYLSNLVIETNEGLQHFQGQPPGTYPIDHFTSKPNKPIVANDSTVFLRQNSNIIAGDVSANMGGCMGCHGVAQSEGFSFSFVLLGGNEGATTDTRTSFDLPPPTVYTPPSPAVYPPYKKE